MAVTELLECPTRHESMRNRQEIQFYGLTIPRIFFQLLLVLEIGLFENFNSISPVIPVYLYEDGDLAFRLRGGSVNV